MEIQKQNIYLVGVMGAGKSTLGRALAERIGSVYVDTDAEVESSCHKSINEIFKQEGELYFRELEYSVIRTPYPQRAVIATGGGLPCHHDTMQYMNENGRTIWLDITLQVLVDRLWNQKEKRPLIANCIDKTDLYNKLNYVRSKRRNFYSQAHIIISKNDISVEDLMNYL